MWELVELDPMTGEEDQCLSPAPTALAKAEAHMAAVLVELEEDWDTGGAPWPWLRVQPAS